MKPVFFCLLVLNIFFMWGIPAYCQDFFVGKVVAVDVQKMEIEVEPQSSLQLFKEVEGRHTVTVRLSKSNSIKTNDRSSPFPECVVPGKKIRLWGEKEKSSFRVFVVTDIRGCGGGGCQDSTGVRSRLRKMWERTYQQLSTTDNNRDGVRAGSGRDGMGAGGGNGGHGNEGGGGDGGGGGRK